MKFSQALRKLVFRDIDVKLYYMHLRENALQEQIAVLLESLKLCNKEMSFQTKIALSNYKSIQGSLNSDEGLQESFTEKIVVKYTV